MNTTTAAAAISNHTMNNSMKRIYSNSTTIKLLKALFEDENYYFSSFSSKNHGQLIGKALANSKQQDIVEHVQLNRDPIWNEFINYLYTSFSDYLSTKDISKTTNDGMIKYEIYSIKSLGNRPKSIWLPRSITISDAHHILSTVLYSNDKTKVPVDLADYVLVYENIMISLENQNKELYEEILKLSFRLNRVPLPPFRLLIIHKSQLLLLERKESKSLLKENETITVLQLLMFHLMTKIPGQSSIENSNYAGITNISSTEHKNEYWPISEIKIGIIPSEHLIHPLSHDKLRQIIIDIVQVDNLLENSKADADLCIKVLEIIFYSVNADVSYIKLISPYLLRKVEIYDYPLLVALPYDRLLLSQFCKIRCSDDRLAQGIMANGKYYSLTTYPYTPMSGLEINPGSIIHLRFSIQSDTIVNGSISSQTNKTIVKESYEQGSVGYCSVSYDNNNVHLMIPSKLIDSIISTTTTTTTSLVNERIDYLLSSLKVSNNWTDSSTVINRLIISDNNQLSTKNTHYSLTYRNNYLHDMSNNDYSLATLMTNASSSSLPLVEKPECLNCLSSLNNDNLECPYCTQVFCRICIESSYDSETRNHCCPKCHNQVDLSSYKKSAIIGKFEREGISAFECLQCHSIPISHRLCRDPKCSALFCYDCCKKAIENQPTAINQELNPTNTIKCIQCKMADTYVSGTVTYYTLRIDAYRTAQQIGSRNPSLPNTVWKEEDYLPELGTLEENHNRIISVIQFNGNHVQFDNNDENGPLLIINEPFEYICLESIQLSYWNTDNDISRWENVTSVKFFQYNQSSIAAYIPHFSIFTARNTRFREHIMLDEAYLNLVYDCDFTNINDTGRDFQRGPEPYIRPCGWYRKAIRVLGKYRDERWLGEGTDAWPVAYHGTATTNTLQILRHGLLAGGSNGIRVVNGQRHGHGIYLSPNPLFAGSPFYAKPLTVDGRRYKVMFQVRVEPSSIRKHNSDIWTCDNSQNVRPYGILFKEG